MLDEHVQKAMALLPESAHTVILPRVGDQGTQDYSWYSRSFANPTSIIASEFEIYAFYDDDDPDNLSEYIDRIGEEYDIDSIPLIIVCKYNILYEYMRAAEGADKLDTPKKAKVNIDAIIRNIQRLDPRIKCYEYVRVPGEAVWPTKLPGHRCITSRPE